MNGLRKVFAISFVVFFVFCISSATAAITREEYSIKGKVVALDPLAQKLTVQSDSKSPSLIRGSLGQYRFSLNEMTKVTMCNQEKGREDIRVGQEVTVSYHGRNGHFYADAINLPVPLMTCLLE